MSEKMELNEWLQSLNDSNLHHMGEYFEQRYNKPFQRRGGYKTAAFKKWWINQNSNAIVETVQRFGFQVLRDWDTYGFFIMKVW